MYPFKRFIQGPNLHEESVSQNSKATGSHRPQLISGEEVKQVYEEIINTAPTNNSNPSSSTHKKYSSCMITRSKSSEKLKILSLNQLMKLCESNYHSELESYLQNIKNSEHSFDINEQDIYGWTLLMSSACAGTTECTKILLRHGSNHLIRDKKGLRASDLARTKGRKDICSLLEEWELYIQTGGQTGTGSDSSSDEEISADPVYCSACSMNFSNQTEHLKSIAHLFSSGEMSTASRTHYGIPESNKGFQMMLRKFKWDKSLGLGPLGEGQKFPVKTVLKRDRKGVGNDGDRHRARVTHFGPCDPKAIEDPRRLERPERTATQQKRDEERRKNRERRKEISFRRQLNSL